LHATSYLAILAAVSLSPEVMMRGLVLGRYLYESGVQQSYQLGFRRAMALLTLHDAVEMLLVLGLQHHDLYNRSRQYRFNEYWMELAAQGVHVTQQGPMQRLNNSRVNLNHHAQLPGRDVVEEARVEARTFFVENTPIIFSVNYEDVSLSSLVTNEDARKYLETADRRMLAGEYDAAIGEIAYALYHLIGGYGGYSERDQWALSRLRSELSSLPLAGDARTQMTMRQIVSAIGAVTRTIEQDQETIRFLNFGLSLGLDFGRWERFRRLTPRVFAQVDGTLRQERRVGGKATLESCRFC
jgi:hypothetical protein